MEMPQQFISEIMARCKLTFQIVDKQMLQKRNTFNYLISCLVIETKRNPLAEATTLWNKMSSTVEKDPLRLVHVDTMKLSVHEMSLC